MTIHRPEQFRDILHTRYLSNVHTTFGDGAETVAGYCEWASEHGYQTIVFSEHVGGRMEYDFDTYCDEIERARETWPSLHLWTGAEATVLPFGNLDIPERILPRLEALFLSCNGFPGDTERYRNALETVFRDDRWKGVPRVWAYPGRYFKSREWTDASGTILKDLIDLAIGENVLIENNVREALPPVWILKSIPLSEIIVGYGAHSITDLTLK